MKTKLNITYILLWLSMCIVQGPTQEFKSLSRCRNMKSGKQNKTLEIQIAAIVGLMRSIESLKLPRKGFIKAWYLSIASAVSVKLDATQRISNTVTPVNVLHRKSPISPCNSFSLHHTCQWMGHNSSVRKSLTAKLTNKKLVVECMSRVA